MSFQTRVEEAVNIAGDFEVKDFYPAPFPDNIPTIELQKISLYKLLNGDEAEAQEVFKICQTTGFFYLDMLDHPIGRELWKSACNICQKACRHFSTIPMAEKLQYKPLGGVRVFDRGYVVQKGDQEGQPDEREFFNIPQSELFGTKIEGGGLPSWLAQNEEVFKETFQGGNIIACSILSILENHLQLSPGTFTKLHQLNDDSGDFIRVLRYPGISDNHQENQDGFPPHKDALSIAILFTWLGGFQLPDPNITIDNFDVKNEDWRWVRPEPGYAIVNLGDAMEIFTNKVLKSGLHRVIKAPGEQRPYDRLSVIIGSRPENSSLMKPVESSIIPYIKQTEPDLTSLEWGHKIVVGIRNRIQRGVLENA